MMDGSKGPLGQGWVGLNVGKVNLKVQRQPSAPSSLCFPFNSRLTVWLMREGFILGVCPIPEWGWKLLRGRAKGSHLITCHLQALAEPAACNRGGGFISLVAFLPTSKQNFLIIFFKFKQCQNRINTKNKIKYPWKVCVYLAFCIFSYVSVIRFIQTTSV